MDQQNLQEGQDIEIPFGALTLFGNLALSKDAKAVVIFAHGGGSGRHSPRNQFVARRLREAGMGTLLFDLLTEEEEKLDIRTARLRFDIPMLAYRLIGVTEFLQRHTKDLKLGYFGASTGAGAALIAAAERPDLIAAVVSRGGRPDLARDYLPQVKAPTLLIVGELDETVIHLYEAAASLMTEAKTQIEIVPRAGHLFEEAGCLEKVALLAADWFSKQFRTTHVPPDPQRTMRQNNWSDPASAAVDFPLT